MSDRIKREFPNFDLSTLPAIPQGFVSTAWHNESCPTWHENQDEPKAGDLMLAIDYADASLRECAGGYWVNLHMYDGAANAWAFYSSNHADDIDTVVAYARYVRMLGLGFHVDTRGRDYVNHADGSRVFSDREAAEYDHVVDAMHSITDPYELAFEIWHVLGLNYDEPDPRCQHRDDGRGQCIDCGMFLDTWEG